MHKLRIVFILYYSALNRSRFPSFSIEFPEMLLSQYIDRKAAHSTVSTPLLMLQACADYWWCTSDSSETLWIQWWPRSRELSTKQSALLPFFCKKKQITKVAAAGATLRNPGCELFLGHGSDSVQPTVWALQFGSFRSKYPTFSHSSGLLIDSLLTKSLKTLDKAGETMVWLMIWPVHIHLYNTQPSTHSYLSVTET